MPNRSPRPLLLFAMLLFAGRAAAQGVTGTWQATTGIELGPWTFALAQDAMAIVGTVRQAGGLTGPVDLRGGVVRRDTISFKASSPDGNRTITFVGAIAGDSIVFNRSVESLRGSGGGTGVFGADGAARFVVRRTDRRRPVALDASASVVPGSQRWVASEGVATPWVFDLVVAGARVTGEARQRPVNPSSPVPLSNPYEITNGTAVGDTIAFTLSVNDSERIVTFRGVRHGDAIDFTRAVRVVSGSPGGNGIVGAAGATSFIAKLFAPGTPIPPAGTVVRPSVSLTGPRRTVNYKGFTIDFTDVAQAPERDSVLKAIRSQLDLVDHIRWRDGVRTFLESIPMVMVDASGSAAYGNGRVAIPLHSSPPYDDTHPIVLHELCHAYNDHRLAGGFRNADVLALYDEARQSGKFPTTSYMLSNPAEYFAMIASVYLYGSAAREPFARDSIRVKQPKMFEWLVKEFGKP